MPQQPHQGPGHAQQAEPAEVLRDFETVAVARLQQQHIVIRYLLQADTARHKVRLDVRQLHRQRKLERRDIEPLRHKFGLQNLALQETH